MELKGFRGALIDLMEKPQNWLMYALDFLWRLLSVASPLKSLKAFKGKIGFDLKVKSKNLEKQLINIVTIVS